MDAIVGSWDSTTTENEHGNLHGKRDQACIRELRLYVQGEYMSFYRERTIQGRMPHYKIERKFCDMS